MSNPLKELKLQKRDTGKEILQDSSNNSQELSRNEHGLSKISGPDLQNHRADNSAEHFNEPYDFSRGDFLEINDLIDLPSSSSCSGNTFTTFMSGDEYIDREALLRELEIPVTPDSNLEYIDLGALLRDLETTAVPATNQRNVDCRFNIASPQGSHQVVIQPPPSGSLGISNNQNPHTIEPGVSASIRPVRRGGLDPTFPATAEERLDTKALNHGSAACEVNHADPSTSQGAKVNGKRKAVGRIAKIRKKYCCCLFPFWIFLSMKLDRKRKERKRRRRN